MTVQCPPPEQGSEQERAGSIRVAEIVSPIEALSACSHRFLTVADLDQLLFVFVLWHHFITANTLELVLVGVNYRHSLDLAQGANTLLVDSEMGRLEGTMGDHRAQPC